MRKKVFKFKPKLKIEGNKIVASDLASEQILKQSFYGFECNEKLCLDAIEALYLVNMRKIPCFYNNNKIGFDELFKKFSKNKRVFAKYNIFRDWRDRGLFLQFPHQVELKNFGHSPMVEYPSKPVEIPRFDVILNYYPDDMISFIFDYEKAKILFEKFWLGQLGVYKQHTRDKILKLDVVETLFLARIGYEVINVKTGEKISVKELEKMIFERNSRIQDLLDVYEDWRSRGYILKTGFKFGAHFRVYFPGASPIKSKSKWLHSKHVLHVFSKDERMIMSEWARAVRVAHGVRKTFIMAIPGMKESDYKKDVDFDFIGYHRKKGDVERPNKDKPRFLILALAEDEEIDGKRLASALYKADELGLRLVIAISDRETAVTYYLAKLINLPGSRNKYYEIEWIQP